MCQSTSATSLLTNLLLLHTMRPSQKPILVDQPKVFCEYVQKIPKPCPANSPADAFYFTPLRRPKQDCWYSNNLSATTHWVLWWGECVILLESLATAPIIPYMQLQQCNYSRKESMNNWLCTFQGTEEPQVSDITTASLRFRNNIFMFPWRWSQQIRNLNNSKPSNQSSDAKLLPATNPSIQYPQFNFTGCTVNITYNK